MSEEEQDLSAALSAAWDAAEANDDQESISESYAGAEETADPADEHDTKVQREAELPGVRDGGDAAQEPVAADESAAVDKAPAGLSPEAREAWKDAPQAIKDHIKAYDQRMEGLAQKYGESFQRMQAMDKSLAPFQQLFAMNGGAQQTLMPLLQTASILQMGSTGQKAQVAANLIKQFGVDIKQLDALLVGEQPQQGPQDQLAQLVDQRLAPLQQQLQHYQQREQQAQQQSQQQISNELSSFAEKNEFYDDVKMEMADLLDMAANRGRQMTLDEAYSIACSTHPSISKIIQNRQSQQSIQAKRTAASSVRGKAGDLAAPANQSRTAALEEAWDNFGRM
jgi:hypothetical protein